MKGFQFHRHLLDLWLFLSRKTCRFIKSTNPTIFTSLNCITTCVLNIECWFNKMIPLPSFYSGLLFQCTVWLGTVTTYTKAHFFHSTRDSHNFVWIIRCFDESWNKWLSFHTVSYIIHTKRCRWLMFVSICLRFDIIFLLQLIKSIKRKNGKDFRSRFQWLLLWLIRQIDLFIRCLCSAYWKKGK